MAEQAGKIHRYQSQFLLPLAFGSNMAVSEVNLDDYSVYSTLCDEELLQIAVERSLSDRYLHPDSDQSLSSSSSSSAPPSSAAPTQTHTNPRRSLGEHPRPRHDVPSSQPPTTGFPCAPNSINPPTGLSRFLYEAFKRELSPLQSLIRKGDAERLMELVRQRSSSVTEPNDEGWIALHEAAYYGQLQCVSILISAHPDSVNSCSLKNQTALLLAAGRGNVLCVDFLLKNGANPNIANKDQETPLFAACEQANKAIVDLLLRFGAQVNHSCMQGGSALHESCRHGQLELCRMLLEAGADLHAKNIYGIQPLFTAAQHGHGGIIRLLAKKGADINGQAQDGASPLFEACKNGHVSAVEELLSLKADANRSLKSGLLPLHVAVQNNHTRIVSLLIPLTSKARVQQSGISPLHIAAEKNRDDIMKVLIESGLNVNAKLSEERSRMYEDRRSTALYFSVYNGNLEASEMLLEAGANPNLDIFNPLLIAVRLDWMDMVKLLLRYGADINARISTQLSSFPAAVLLNMESLPMLKLLLDNGCDARSCFDCPYGQKPHPPIMPPGRPIEEMQFCEAVSRSSFCRVTGPIISMLLDYVSHVHLCSRLLEVLESRSDWALIKVKADRKLIVVRPHSSIMTAASVSHSGSAGPTLAIEDYSLYSNLSDEELLQLAIERSLTDAHCINPTTVNTPAHSPDSSSRQQDLQPNSAARNTNRPSHSAHNPPPPQTTVHYSSPNPPSEKPPDPKTFDGTVSHFMTGSGKRMVAYRRPDGFLVHIAPEPEEEEEPLFKAIHDGDAVRVKTLVMRPGTNLMLPSKPGWLAIHQAAWYGQDACLRILLSAQPGMINKRTERGESALLVAVSKEKLSCIEVLLESGADIDIANYERETPLYKACERNSAAMVAMLLNCGASVNTHCIQGWTALQEAVCRNNVEICEMLLKAGAKLNLTNMYGISPLFTAAQSGQLATLRFLLRHGADINSEAADGATALYEAAKNGHEEIVELLLSQNADANKPGKTGLLPLHIAAQKGSDTIVSMLIPATSKARIRRTGISPLHLAAERNRDDVLEALIKAGFDVNAQLSEERSKLYEDRRSTVLYFSVINNNIDAVRMLLVAGANPNLDVFRPLMVAARLGCIQTITLLVEHGADINACIPTHPTTFPAVYMFSMKYLSMFKYLLDHGCHALSCFDCVYGSKPHPPIKTTRSERGDLHYTDSILSDTQQRRGVQFCEMISAPSICRWAGPIIDVLLDYVGNVTLCSRLMEHLESYSDWSVTKDKAALPRPLLQLCRLQILQLVGHQHVKRLPLPGGLIRFLEHKEGCTDDF
ncbi:hypothetical protein L3Q82_011488 [Scortum barcoo]|uniref:Uncharacterized protein n=1 Tax=Scortum barcoo TaxID=214431 RepID=A0ACB8WBQ3_9TELE|nr:hypothetical protein L3Q82_011488 [Scortum barcoo]